MPPKLQRIQMDSNEKCLDNMNLHDLCDLLVVKTSALLSVLHQKSENGFKIRNLKSEVEEIQEAIQSKKSRITQT